MKIFKTIRYLEKKVLNRLQRISSFGWRNYPSYFNSHLDKLTVSSLSDTLTFVGTEVNEKTEHGFRILHIASSILSIGGHSRVLLNWLEKDTSSEHSLFISRKQEINPVLSSIISLGPYHNINGIDFESEKLVEVCEELWGFYLKVQPDIIVLHSHPNDPVPFAALANRKGVPIVFYDHADYVFSIGRSLADTTELLACRF